MGEIKMDARVLAFAAGVSCLSGLAASLAAVWQTWRTDVNSSLKAGSGQQSTDVGRGRLRNALVIAEIALALLLTIGAGLLLRTFANLRGVAPGFETSHALTFELTAQGPRYDTAVKINDLYARAQDRLRALPGVAAVAVVNRLPLDRWFNLPYRLAAEKNKFSGSAEYRLISPAYFDVMKMALQRGRAFNDGDTAGAEPVVIINESFARKHFAQAEPLGQTVAVCCDERGDLAPRRIIGVVNATKQRDLSSAAPATVFLPLSQTVESRRDFLKQASFIVRTTGEPLALGAAVRHELRQLDAALPLRNLRTFDQLRDRSVAAQRFNLSLLGLFAALGLLLAAIGTYGVMAYGVAQRTHEIGLRMALGAQTRDVLRLVVRQGMLLTAIGIGIGLVTAIWATRLMTGLLFGVRATDPLTFVAIALLLAFVALIACWLPARRATRVDPMVALRIE
jgi:predicted permease